MNDDLTVVVVDDHATLAELLELAVSAEPGLRCVGTASGMAAGLELVRRLRPDIVVMDVELGDGDGIEATSVLTRECPEVRVVVLTARVDARILQRAADAGACALVPKSGPLMHTLRSIREAERGGLDVDPGLLRELIQQRARGALMSVPELTAREYEVLALLAEGLDVRRISERLTISQHTCRGHVKRLLTKFDAHSQLETVAKAIKLGLVSAASA